jgi:transcriptional regulator with XRE-family HTH domain
MMTMPFGQWLRRQLIRREMKQADLARKLEMRPGVVSYWLSDKRVPSVVSCYLIADALDLPSSHVLTAAGHPVEVDPEDRDEAEDRLLTLWRKLSDDGKDAVMQFVEFQRGRDQG